MLGALRIVLSSMLIFLFVGGTSLKAQWSIGFGGGGDLNDLQATRWYIGTERQITSAVHFQFELSYERKINRLEFPGLPEDFRFNDIFFDYVGSQFLLNPSFEFNKINLGVLTGPYLAYGTNLVALNPDVDAMFGDQITFDQLDLYRFDYGWVFGGEMQQNLNERIFMIVDLRFAFGLRDLHKDAAIALSNDNLNMSLGLHYRLGVGSKKGNDQPAE